MTNDQNVGKEKKKKENVVVMDPGRPVLLDTEIDIEISAEIDIEISDILISIV